jgi:hypothetical protein
MLCKISTRSCPILSPFTYSEMPNMPNMPTSADDVTNRAISKMAHLSPLGTQLKSKGVPMIRLSSNKRDSSDTSGAISGGSKNSRATDESTPSPRGRAHQTITNDAGPRTGNRATSAPKCVISPDVDAFLKHLASHKPRPRSEGSTSAQSPRLRNSTRIVRTPICHPLFAGGHRHGEIKRPAEPYKITQAVWDEFSRQQKVNKSVSRPVVGEAGRERKDSVANNAAVQRAIKERSGGYRQGGG